MTYDYITLNGRSPKKETKINIKKQCLTNLLNISLGNPNNNNLYLPDQNHRFFKILSKGDNLVTHSEYIKVKSIGRVLVKNF